jgi:hypothetical protein
MNLTTEALIAGGIIVSMALQFGDHPASVRRLLAPLAIIAGFAIFYLKTIPTSGGDGLFALVGVGSGLVLGLLAAALMGVRRGETGQVMLSAGVPYVALWIVTFGGRLAFALTATNNPQTLRGLFSWAFQHGVTEAGWIALFMFSAIVMIGLRTLIVGTRVLKLVRTGEVEARAA